MDSHDAPPAAPASPPSRKPGGKSLKCPLSDRAVRAKNEVEAGEDNPINAGALKKKRSSIGQDEFDDACNDASQGIGALQAGDATAPPPPPPVLRAQPLGAVLESVAPPVARAPGGPYFDEARRQAVIDAIAGAGSEEERVKIMWAAFGRSGP